MLKIKISQFGLSIGFQGTQSRFLEVCQHAKMLLLTLKTLLSSAASDFSDYAQYLNDIVAANLSKSIVRTLH